MPKTLQTTLAACGLLLTVAIINAPAHAEPVIHEDELYVVNDFCPGWNDRCRKKLDNCYLKWRNHSVRWYDDICTCMKTRVCHAGGY